MPTYEYKCTSCGRRFEIFHSMTEAARTECEVCEVRLKKLIGPGAGIIFKGSGFYCTDYRSEDYKKKAQKDNGTASKTSASTSASGSGNGQTKSDGDSVKSNAASTADSGGSA